MNAPIDLTAAHQSHRDHALWNRRANILARHLRDPLPETTRTALQRGLDLAEQHVARLAMELRIEPPREPERVVNLYPGSSHSMAMDPGVCW